MINLDIKETVLMKGDQEVSVAYLDGVEVYSSGLPVGTVFNFDYTGTVQEVELPRGRYKLQCWGSQGGYSSRGIESAYAGSFGGYSEGVLNLDKKTKLYVFVGGMTNVTASAILQNGGWNGGGGSVGNSSKGSTAGSSVTSGFVVSYPGSGGGGTDIATVTSTMEYSEGRTNRSLESLLSRFIVAGGGAGGNSRYAAYTAATSSTERIYLSYESNKNTWYSEALGSNMYYRDNVWYGISGYRNKSITITMTGGSNTSYVQYILYSSSGEISRNRNSSPTGTFSITVPDNTAHISFQALNASLTSENKFVAEYPASLTTSVTTVVSGSTTKYSNEHGDKLQRGGGITGYGIHPGTLSAGGVGTQSGGFGYGAAQIYTGYRFASSGAGGGWYGGGTNGSNSYMYYINYTGGGSGFVNIPENASYRPEGYTGLELESGTTIKGNTMFESPSGGTEIGHAGNGYAKITVIE